MVKMHGRVTPRRVVVWLLVAGLVLMLVMLGYRVWRVWRAARPLIERLDTVQALAATRPMSTRNSWMAELEPRIRGVLGGRSLPGVEAGAVSLWES